jgi:eukaryotic-like serine/threonine-protein kinase
VDLWLMSTNGASNARFTFDPAEEVTGVWSRDGSMLAYRSVVTDGATIFSKRISGLERALLSVPGGTITPLLNRKANENNGQISPDGKWVAYASDESGAWEIYVTSFPGATGKWQVSRGGGTEPRWRGDGKGIFYLAPSGMLMAAPVNAKSDFATGSPAALFQISTGALRSPLPIFLPTT